MPFQDLGIDWKQYLIIPALREFYASPDGVLVHRRLGERNLAAHIYFYMRGLFERFEYDTAKLSIDCEYNKNYTHPKGCYQKCGGCDERNCIVREFFQNPNFGEYSRKLIPDIIIHERNSNNNNQIALEIKRQANQKQDARMNDYAKLSFLTCQRGAANDPNDYKYNVGYFIDLGDNDFIITRYKNHIAGVPRRIQCL